MHPHCPCVCTCTFSGHRAECTPCTWGFLHFKYWVPSECHAQLQALGCWVFFLEGREHQGGERLAAAG